MHPRRFKACILILKKDCANCNSCPCRQLQLAGLQPTPATSSSLQLWAVAGKCAGMSGRTIRKISFLALALFSGAADRGTVTLAEFLESLDKAVVRQLKDREEFTKEN